MRLFGVLDKGWSSEAVSHAGFTGTPPTAGAARPRPLVVDRGVHASVGHQ